VAGTPVHADGGLRPIEDVRPGDRVWAFDRQRQAWALCPVERAFERTSDRLATIRLAGGTELTGTDGHPVWVVEGEGLATRPHGDHGADEPAGPTPGRWVALAALRVGDVVLTRLGRVARVTGVEVRAEVVPVYNFEVGRLHSYAVGDAGVLVHNADRYEQDLVKAAAEAAQRPASPNMHPEAGAPHAGTSHSGGSEVQLDGKKPPEPRTTTPSGAHKNEWKLPAEGKNGTWVSLDDAGNGVWESTDPRILEYMKENKLLPADATSVRFAYRNYAPDFGPYVQTVNGTKAEVRITLSSDATVLGAQRSKNDYKAADQAVADALNRSGSNNPATRQPWTQQDIQEIRDVQRLTWHHVEDVDVASGEATMQLVPRRVHKYVYHERGGRTIYDRALGLTN